MALWGNKDNLNIGGIGTVYVSDWDTLTVTGSGNIFLGNAFTSSLNISGSFHVQSETDDRGTLNISGATNLDFNRLLSTTEIVRRKVKHGEQDTEQKFPNCGSTMDNTTPNTPVISGNNNTDKKLTIETTSDNFGAYGNLTNVTYILGNYTKGRLGEFSMDDDLCNVQTNKFELNGTYSFSNYNYASVTNLELAGDTTIDFNESTIHNLKVNRKSGVSNEPTLTLQDTNFVLSGNTASANGLINISPTYSYRYLFRQKFSVIKFIKS